MTKKYFVVSDVHGFYDLMKKSLDTAGFDISNPNHIFVSCGDLMDRGDKPYECLQFVNMLPANRKILIRGNHEDLFIECCVRGEALSHDITNGTHGTLWEIFLHDKQSSDIYSCGLRNKEVNDYFNSLVDFYETEHYIFVHGWIPCFEIDHDYYKINDWRNVNKAEWDRARWINGMDAWNQGIKENGKVIVCGHYHTSWGHCHIDHICKEWGNKYSTNPEHRKFHSEPFIHDGIIALDGCTALSHKVNCVVVFEDKEID